MDGLGRKHITAGFASHGFLALGGEKACRQELFMNSQSIKTEECVKCERKATENTSKDTGRK